MRVTRRWGWCERLLGGFGSLEATVGIHAIAITPEPACVANLIVVGTVRAD